MLLYIIKYSYVIIFHILVKVCIINVIDNIYELITFILLNIL